jgi:hypothetical protein
MVLDAKGTQKPYPGHGMDLFDGPWMLRKLDGAVSAQEIVRIERLMAVSGRHLLILQVNEGPPDADAIIVERARTEWRWVSQVDPRAAIALATSGRMRQSSSFEYSDSGLRVTFILS